MQLPYRIVVGNDEAEAGSLAAVFVAARTLALDLAENGDPGASRVLVYRNGELVPSLTRRARKATKEALKHAKR